MDQKKNTDHPAETGIHVSVVSHGQDELVNQFLYTLAAHCPTRHLVVTITRNTPSSLPFIEVPFPVRVVTNPRPKGFGANHNQAFSLCREAFFCVMNPDILLLHDPFEALIAALADKKIGVAAPLLVDSSGRIQDSARTFPTPLRIAARFFPGKNKGHEYCTGGNDCSPDWLAGMFMLFPSAVYRLVGGFDERYFMYCEDADICKRLADTGRATRLVTSVQAVHNPRRASRATLTHLRWHIASLIRFFLTYPFYTL